MKTQETAYATEIITTTDLIWGYKPRCSTFVNERELLLSVKEEYSGYKIDSQNIESSLNDLVFSGKYIENTEDIMVGDIVYSVIHTTSFEYEYDIYFVISEISENGIKVMPFREPKQAMNWQDIVVSS